MHVYTYMYMMCYFQTGMGKISISIRKIIAK